MISISVGLLGGLETPAASVGKKGEDGPAFADTFEQAAAGTRTKIVAGGTQGAVKVDRGTGQARKASRSAQGDGGVKQGGLSAAKDVVQGLKGGVVVGKKIADVAELVEEQVAGGLGDGKGLQTSVAGVGVALRSAQTGKGRVVSAAKDGAGSAVEVAGAAVKVAGLSEGVTVPSTGVLQSGVQQAIGISRDGAGGTLGASVVAQKPVPVGSGNGAEGAIGGSIRPDLKGATDVAVATLPVAAHQGGELASATVPVVAGNSAASIDKGLTHIGDKNVSAEVASVESGVVAFVPGRSFKGEDPAIAEDSPQIQGVSLPKTISQARTIVAGDAAADSAPEIAQVVGGTKGLADGAVVLAGQRTVAPGGLESSVGQAVGPKTAADPLATDSESSTTSVPVKGVTASPIGSVQVGSPVAVTSGVIHAGLVSVTPDSTDGEIGTEEMDGRLGSGTLGTEPSPVTAKNDGVEAVALPQVAVRTQGGEVASSSPRVAIAEERDVAAFQGATAEPASNRVGASKSVPGQDGSKTAVKSAGRHGETARARETSAASTGGESRVAEASAPVVAASAFVSPTAVAPGAVAASVVPTPILTPVAAPVPLMIPTDTAANETVGEVTAVAGPRPAATSGLKASRPVDSVEAGKNVTLPSSLTEAVASRVEGLKATQSSAGQAPMVPAEQALPNVSLTEAGQGIEGRSPGNVPADTTAASGAVAVGVSEGAAAVAPVKAGQERKAVGGAASVAGRERKGVAVESKTADVAASAGAVDAGRVVAFANSSDPAVASVKPAAAEHRAQGSEGGQVSAAPVGIVDGAAVQAHVASTMPVNAAPAASASANAPNSVGAAGGAHAGSVGGSAGDSLVSPMAHTTLQATPTVLEVGVPGGTHGWLKIRAEIGEGGAVTASMSASSHAGQDALRRDLPAMNAFLESEHVPVSVQLVHGIGSSWADKDGAMTQAGAGLGSGLGQSSGQDGQGSARGEAGAGMLADAGGRQQGGNASSQDGLVSETRGRSEGAGRNVVEGDAAWSPAPGYGSGVRANGGSWLNVVA